MFTHVLRGTQTSVHPRPPSIMSAVPSLSSASNVSTGRACNVCRLGITTTEWYVCRDCFDFECCLDCWTKNKEPARDDAVCQPFSRSSQRLANLAPPSPVRDGGELRSMGNKHTLQAYSYAALRSNDLYNEFLKRATELRTKRARDKAVETWTNTEVAAVTSRLKTLSALAERKEDEQSEFKTLQSQLIQFHINGKSCKILSLDGGGTRGYLTILALKEVIGGDVTLDDQSAFVKEFDILAGTSTGGLISFCLAVGYPINDLQEIYSKAKDYFILSSNWTLGASEFPVYNAKYDATKIEGKIKEILKQVFPGTEAPTMAHLKSKLEAEGKKSQQWVVNVFDTSSNRALILNSRAQADQSYKLFDLLRGTMAGPLYFTPHHFVHDGKKRTFIDGGVFANDPALTALYIARLTPEHTINTQFTLIGIGTGVHDTFWDEDSIDGGGLKTWITGLENGRVNKWLGSAVTDGRPGGIPSGLLPNMMLEAQRSFNEKIVSELGRLPTLRRFKYNISFNDTDANLDDMHFAEKVDAKWGELRQAADMLALRWFFERRVKNSAVVLL